MQQSGKKVFILLLFRSIDVHQPGKEGRGHTSETQLVFLLTFENFVCVLRCIMFCTCVLPLNKTYHAFCDLFYHIKVQYLG